MCVESTGKGVVKVCCNLDGFMPFDGVITVSDLFHCSFQEIVHIFDAAVHCGISLTGLNVCEC